MQDNRVISMHSHFQLSENMSVNYLIIEYPKGVDISVTFKDAAGRMVNTVAMAPPLLLRLGSTLEFEGMTSGNLRTLLDMSLSDSDDDSDGDKESGTEEDDDGDKMEEDPAPDGDSTIDLVSSEDDDDDDDGDDDDDEDQNSDMISVTHPTDA